MRTDWKDAIDRVRRSLLTERGKERERETVREGPVRVDAEVWKPLAADVTATERHYSRSVKIRRAIYAYMAEQVGQPFHTWEDLQGGASLYAGCGMETARRWLITYSSAGGDFEITEQPGGIVIWRREDLK